MDFTYRDDVTGLNRSNHISVEGQRYVVMNNCLTIPDRDAVAHLDEIFALGFRPGRYVQDIHGVDQRTPQEIIAEADAKHHAADQATGAAVEAKIALEKAWSAGAIDPTSKAKADAVIAAEREWHQRYDAASAAMDMAKAAEVEAAPLRRKAEEAKVSKPAVPTGDKK